MPIFLAVALVGAFLWSRTRQAHAGELSALTPAEQAINLQGTLAPGAAAFLPPVNAPMEARIAFANAAASRNPILMVNTAQQLMVQGQPELARALSALHANLTNQPIPGIPTGVSAAAGAYGRGSALVAIGAMSDPRVLLLLRRLAQRRRLQRAARQLHLAQLFHHRRTA